MPFEFLSHPAVKGSDKTIFLCEVRNLIRDPFKYGVYTSFADYSYDHVKKDYAGITGLEANNVMGREQAAARFLTTAALLELS